MGIIDKERSSSKRGRKRKLSHYSTWTSSTWSIIWSTPFSLSPSLCCHCNSSSLAERRGSEINGLFSTAKRIIEVLAHLFKRFSNSSIMLSRTFCKKQPLTISMKDSIEHRITLPKYREARIRFATIKPCEW